MLNIILNSKIIGPMVSEYHSGQFTVRLIIIIIIITIIRVIRGKNNKSPTFAWETE